MSTDFVITAEGVISHPSSSMTIGTVEYIEEEHGYLSLCAQCPRGPEAFYALLPDRDDSMNLVLHHFAEVHL